MVTLYITFEFQEEHLDSQQGVIDFSLYLRHKKDVGNDDCDAASSEHSAASAGGNMAAVLDQKTYIEEVNQTLK